GRLELAGKVAAGAGAAPQRYLAANFDRLLAELKPDAVIVTTPDATHDDYIVRALDAGCDAITEKPLTTTPEKAQRILDACKKSGRHVRVLFNYRYSPPRTQVKDLLMKGAIGDVLSVDFHWLLNTVHGADYFRRWHSQKKMSGGLMVHKATHHFDLVNWWLGTEPELVMAYGKREYYTPAMAQRMGLASHHERCRTCPEKAACSFYLDLAADPAFKELYLDNEQHDGYFRDRCVFRPEIDIEDNMSVIVRYRTGATLSYSLNGSCAWEGYQIAFNGTKGRIEHEIVEQAFTAGATLPPGAEKDAVRTRLIPLRGAPQEIQPWTGTGGHGGGDNVMLSEVFGTAAPDPYQRAADERSGMYSILIGAAANRCFSTGRAVTIADLVHGLTPPSVAPMPNRATKLPMPKRS
ncbi:MAG TPA: Gfo/Idh/MocA family oxidoreductase, partial [Polyangiaceae bacterium]|nr:Gfo/Idh/MocA family oxidoreductase [Polyangiaceae bacterium]